MLFVEGIKSKHGKVALMRNCTPRREDVLESGGRAPYILKLEIRKR